MLKESPTTQSQEKEMMGMAMLVYCISQARMRILRRLPSFWNRD